MTPAGDIHVLLQVQDGHICGLQVLSTRPDVAGQFLSGRSVAAVRAAVPLMFAVCGVSQSVACELALAAATNGESPALLAESSAAVAAESLRETACQVLLRWPGWINERPAAAAVTASRAMMAGASHHAESASAAQRQTCALAVFGCSAPDWLALDTWPALWRWAAGGGTATARSIAMLRARDCASPTLHLAPALLPPPAAAWLAPLARRALDEPGFCASPLWQAQAAETGALARLQHDPLLHQPAARPAGRTLLRAVARLRELASQLAWQQEGALGSAQLEPGVGMAWVDTARGLLLHVARVQSGQVLDYRILAPTEWNLHPQGALASALLGAPAPWDAAAVELATRCIATLDPCVAFSVSLSVDITADIAAEPCDA